MGKVVRHTCCHDDTWFVTLEEEEMRKNLGHYIRMAGSTFCLLTRNTLRYRSRIHSLSGFTRSNVNKI